jgi:RNA polymerase II C-terminal domain phosphatase-like 3/4
MEEQERMFSARKLCLVLDLDHTLLNSAKVLTSIKKKSYFGLDLWQSTQGCIMSLFVLKYLLIVGPVDVNQFSEIEPEWDQRLRVAENAEKNRTARDGVERRELYRFPHMSMWTKLRPGIWKFLARVHSLPEILVAMLNSVMRFLHIVGADSCNVAGKSAL